MNNFVVEIIDMPEISRFFGIVIRMYFGDHNPPHFHANYQDASAEYNIFTLELMQGSLPERAHALVLEWATIHREELEEDWRLASEMKVLNKIAPLK
jgi:hypothetical protein